MLVDRIGQETTVSGDLNILKGASASVSGGSAGGTSDISAIQSQHVHVVDDPAFPTVDTNVFVPYAVNVSAGAEVPEVVRPFLPLAERLGAVLTGLGNSSLGLSDQAGHADHEELIEVGTQDG